MADKTATSPPLLPIFAETPAAQLATQSFSFWATNTALFQSEALRFAADRFAKDLQIPGRLAACRTPAEFFAVEFAIACEAVDDYLAAGRHILELTTTDFETAAEVIS